MINRTREAFAILSCVVFLEFIIFCVFRVFFLFDLSLCFLCTEHGWWSAFHSLQCKCQHHCSVKPFFVIISFATVLIFIQNPFFVSSSFSFKSWFLRNVLICNFVCVVLFLSCS